MDLKDFIKATITGIVEATRELQEAFGPVDVIVNPPVSAKDRDLYEVDGAQNTYRQIQIVEFDVAISATAGTEGGGNAGLKILSVEASMKGQHSRSNEQVSRVKFSIPVTLSPSTAEAKNLEALEKQQSKNREVESQAQAKRANRKDWIR